MNRAIRLLAVASLSLYPAALWSQSTSPYDFVRNGVQQAKVTSKNGVPQLLINNQPVPPLMFLYNDIYPNRAQNLAPQIQLARAAGIRMFQVAIPPFDWDTGPGGPPEDYSNVDRKLDRFLSLDPNAVLLLRLDVAPGNRWNPPVQPTAADRIVYQDGTVINDHYHNSPASDIYFNGFITSARKLIRHYEASRYAPRILGYIITAQNTGEWFPVDFVTKGPDYSAVNKAAFRAWLRAKYTTDANLSRAWARNVTLNNAEIPIPSPGRFPVGEARLGSTVDSMYRLPQEQDWVDYSYYVSDLNSQRILDIARMIRQETAGKRLIGFFYAYLIALPSSFNGHLRVDRLLRSPDIDFLSSPKAYLGFEVRFPGGPGGSHGALDSIAARGKLWWIEDDLRTYIVKPGEWEDYLGPQSIANAQDTANVLQRNMAFSIAHRAGTWWMDLAEVGAFNDASLWKTMSDFGLPLFDKLNADPKPYRPEVAFVVDPESVNYQKSDWDFFSLPRLNLRNNIAVTGAVVGYYHLEDFLDGTLPPCRVYVFANAWYLTDDQITKIRSRLEAEGATAIWQYGPGYLGPTGPDLNRMSRLTGMRFVSLNGNTATRAEGLLRGLPDWGWPGRTISPRFVVADEESTVLGRYRDDGQIGAAMKTVGNFRSIFIGDMLWSPELMQRLFKLAGVHLFAEQKDVIHTDGDLLVIHGAKAGDRQFRLPFGTAATRLTGEVIARHPDPLTLKFSVTGENHWLRLTKSNQPVPAIRGTAGVLSAASLESGMSAGGWISIFGNNFAATSRIWTGSDFRGSELPTRLDGVGVLVNGVPAPVYYISPTQINALLPGPIQDQLLEVQVVTPLGITNTLLVAQTRFSPSFFLFDPQGRRFPAATFADGLYVGPPGLFGNAAPSRPAKVGENVILYASGLGPTSPAYPEGRILDRAYPCAQPVRVTVGGVDAPIDFAGLVSPGQYQINIRVPAVSSGEQELLIHVGGATSPKRIQLVVAP